MEIIQERLEREFNLDLITTAPGVRYRVTTTNGEVIEVDSPSKMPETGSIAKIEEPFIEATILTNDALSRRNPAAFRRKTRRAEKV